MLLHVHACTIVVDIFAQPPCVRTRAVRLRVRSDTPLMYLMCYDADAWRLV